jgi:hypothetical protein
MRFTLMAAAAVLSLAGCPAPETGPTCEDVSPPATFDALKPAVSFARDVTPLLSKSCAFSTCHGSSAGPANGVYLGTDLARVQRELVTKSASELPTMPLVTPGDPRQSYLMRKLDGSQCALDAQCLGGSCGDTMPRGEQPLPIETRDVVRRWIAQGAKND